MIDHNELVQGVLKLVPILRLPEDVKEPDTVVIGVLRSTSSIISFSNCAFISSAHCELHLSMSLYESSFYS